jgi:hypothetical protein
VLKQTGDAQAGGDLALHAEDRDGRDSAADLLRDQVGVLQSGVREQDEELLDAESACEVAGPQTGSEGGADRGKDDLVALAMTEAVVALFEVVKGGA